MGQVRSGHAFFSQNDLRSTGGEAEVGHQTVNNGRRTGDVPRRQDLERDDERGGLRGYEGVCKTCR